MKPRVVYYDHERGGDQPGFARGEAGHGKLVETGGLASEMRVPIPANAYHALLGHGVVEELNRLPLDGGPVGSGHEAWIRPAAAEQAAHILYEADRKTYGGSWEFVAGRQDVPERIEYRIAIHNRQYQSTLSKLQFLAVTASRHGWAVALLM